MDRPVLSRSRKYVFSEPPWWAPHPLKHWLYHLTYDELHATLIAQTGLVFGVTFPIIPYITAITVSILIGMAAAPHHKLNIIFLEPWYFFAPFAWTFLLTLILL